MICELEADKRHTAVFENLNDFECLFRDTYPRMVAYANRFLRNTEEAEEIVQDLFCKLWGNRLSLEVKGPVHAYLFRSVRNACLNKIKHDKIREKYAGEMMTGNNGRDYVNQDSLDASELERHIRNSIDMLPPARKQVFILSRYEGLKYHEIAGKLGISVKTVENQMGKAIQFMREQLKDYLVTGCLVILELLL
ncbi:MAG: RNA polymerase sigma-70 factor [Bacteroidota bacterium]